MKNGNPTGWAAVATVRQQIKTYVTTFFQARILEDLCVLRTCPCPNSRDVHLATPNGGLHTLMVPADFFSGLVVGFVVRRFIFVGCSWSPFRTLFPAVVIVSSLLFPVLLFVVLMP